MKTFNVLSFVSLLVLASSQISCGSDSGSGSGSCGKVYPCGGAIAGNWKIVDSCFTSTDSAPPDFCPTAMMSTKDFKITGSVNYKTDMTYAVMGQFSGTVIMDLPNSCLTTLDATCAEFDAAEKAQIAQDPDSPFSAVSCVTKGASCGCSFTLSAQTTMETGTYTTSGTKLTETAAGEAPEESNYCAQGTTLHITELDMTMPMGSMGQFKIASDVVLTKQ